MLAKVEKIRERILQLNWQALSKRGSNRSIHTEDSSIPIPMDLRGIPRGGNLLLKLPLHIGCSGGTPFNTG